MTNKEAVQASLPNAYAYQWADCWVIYEDRNGERQGHAIGTGKTRELAWSNAHERIKSEHPK